ncbi:MAG: hypothetical protein GJ678_03210 [Rhodobacteraceae bacterium]|nr:hypothetical protein [Paracoccaceae bacterium]
MRKQIAIWGGCIDPVFIPEKVEIEIERYFGSKVAENTPEASDTSLWDRFCNATCSGPISHGMRCEQ